MPSSRHTPPVVSTSPWISSAYAELLEKVKANAGVDWQHSENARARIRVMVKRILRKHGYPPDMQDAAVRLVLEQAEALSATWAA